VVELGERNFGRRRGGKDFGQWRKGKDFGQRRGERDFGQRRGKFLERAKMQVKTAFSQKDLLLMQAMRSLDDLDDAKEILHSRVAEWFKLNFPEFELDNEETACKIVAEFGCKENLGEKKLEEIVGEKKAKELVEKARSSYGAEFGAEEIAALKALAKQVLELVEARKKIEAYVEAVAKEYLKNISFVSDPVLAARLLTTAGGLERLAKMPASTIQVIGAEKALFKHLRRGTKPPKHGVIFQSALIRGAPFEQRGRIARVLATKICIAAKADYYTKRFIAEKLKADLEARLEKIRE
jgi:nucleolar protein 56